MNSDTTAGRRRALIVHAHPEPQSFSSALFRQAVQTLAGLGYHVDTSDLYAMGWDPVSDQRNFSTVANPSYFKQQIEEMHAAKVGGFVPAVEVEMQKLESCDLLIFSFPLWWYSMPAILKGWVDRVFAMGRVYGGPRKYENGIGKREKRALVIMTTGGSPVSFSGYGMNVSLESILKPIEQGIFWFNGFQPLAPFVAWNPARASAEERADYLAQLAERLRGVEEEAPREFPLLSDFKPDGTDGMKRFMVRAIGDGGGARLDELRRRGVLLNAYWSESSGEGYLVFREANQDRVRQQLRSVASFASLEIVELAGR